MPEVIVFKHIYKRYSLKDGFVLNDVSLSVGRGECTALLGPSGSGKSTLLHIAGLLDLPTDGTIVLNGRSVAKLSENEKAAMRLHKIGFVYQYHHLLQEFSALENVMLPMLIASKSKKEARNRAEYLLGTMQLSNKMQMFPSELSGGQKQRVAIARALANDPVLLLADEPTGNLDPETAHAVFEDLLKIMQSSNMSAIIATHNYELAQQMHKQYSIEDGHLLEK